MMKTLLLTLSLVTILSSCDPNSDKEVGSRDRFRGSTNNGTGGTGSGGGTGGGNQGSGGSTPTDAPLDGGLSILLVAGAAYGANRFRKNKKATDANA